jgi:hypothetical protein
MGSEQAGRPGKGSKPLSDSEKLRLGPSIWIRGCIVIATDGLLTLRSRGTQMTVRNEDVRSKKEVEGQLMVELSADANIILRTENVVRAGGGQCGGAACDGAADGTGTSARLAGDNSFPDPFYPNYVCQTEWQQVMTHCHWVQIGCERHWVCIPEWRQVTVCWHEGSGGIA